MVVVTLLMFFHCTFCLVDIQSSCTFTYSCTSTTCVCTSACASWSTCCSCTCTSRTFAHNSVPFVVLWYLPLVMLLYSSAAVYLLDNLKWLLSLGLLLTVGLLIPLRAHLMLMCGEPLPYGELILVSGTLDEAEWSSIHCAAGSHVWRVGQQPGGGGGQPKSVCGAKVVTQPSPRLVYKSPVDSSARDGTSHAGLAGITCEVRHCQLALSHWWC